MGCKFKVGDKVTTTKYEELKDKVGVVKNIEIYEDYDGDDENYGPIYLIWYYLDIDFDGKMYNIKDWNCKKVEESE